MTYEYTPCMFDEMPREEAEIVMAAALSFADAAHAGQARKYSGAEYVTHPRAVARLLDIYGVRDVHMIVAAVLHDTVEDNAAITVECIAHSFGPDVAHLVAGLTNKFKGGIHGSRAERKRKEAERLAQCIPQVKTIKLADKLHNLPDIIDNDPDKDFVAIYVAEARYLLDNALKEGDNALWMAVDSVINEYYETQKDAA